MSRMATVMIGAIMQPIPTPAMASGSAKVNELAVVDSTMATPPIPAAKKRQPISRM